jgi:hypothetical protein
MVIVWMFFCFGQLSSRMEAWREVGEPRGFSFSASFSMQVGRWNVGVPIVTFILRHGLSHDF